jgi:sugar transferase (PEP-CTERM/EpsH1 system associated)
MLSAHCGRPGGLDYRVAPVMNKFTSSAPPLVMHVLFRFATGGLENGVVNLVNRMAPGRFRHLIVALETVDSAFAARIVRPEVRCIALNKPPGHALRLYPGFVQLLRRERPAVVHTRNLAALEMQVPAAWARVPLRVHGEHGWDAADPGGQDRRQQRIRRLYSPFVHRYVALSRELERYLVERVGIAAPRVETICNGVDTQRFVPAAAGAEALAGCPFDPTRHWIVGTVGRLQQVKNQTLLVEAFGRALAAEPAMGATARLVLVGDGPLRTEVERRVAALGLGEHVWMAGERHDVPATMRALHLFVLPSLAEGISNTILEAMASGLPVLATAVGGNAELVQPERTGLLVPSNDAEAMAAVLRRLWATPASLADWARTARREAEARFSLDTMVERYARVYESGCGR